MEQRAVAKILKFLCPTLYLLHKTRAKETTLKICISKAHYEIWKFGDLACGFLF